VTGARATAVLIAAMAVVACGGNTGSAATPRPKPVRVAEPGPLALAPDGALLVGDRRLHRVVRIDVRTKRRRVVATGLPDIVELSYDDMGRLYVCAASRVYRIDGRRKVVVAGTGRREHTGDGGPATAASLSGPGGFEVDHDERIVIAEYDNWIRAVEPDGTIGTIAGTGAEGYAGDGGPARDALLRHPHDIALRRDREVVIADSHNGVLRLVDATGTMRTLARGLDGPIVVEGGPLDTLYVADARLGSVIRFDAAGGNRTTVATGVSPIGLAVDERRNVYVSEFQGRVLRISPTGRRTVLVPRAR
jgi:sugar lactone lactonase YvrE